MAGRGDRTDPRAGVDAVDIADKRNVHSRSLSHRRRGSILPVAVAPGTSDVRTRRAASAYRSRSVRRSTTVSTSDTPEILRKAHMAAAMWTPYATDEAAAAPSTPNGGTSTSRAASVT